MQVGPKSEQLQRQIETLETLETQFEDLAAGRGVADLARAQARGADASSSNATTDEAASRQALPAHLSREDHVLKP
jgi:transposase